MDKATLHIARADEGISDRNRAYKIVVNGEHRGKIRKGETKTIEVEPGEVEVYLKIDWCRSPKRSFDARRGTEARFACGPKHSLTWLGTALFNRTDYLWLKPEESAA